VEQQYVVLGGGKCHLDILHDFDGSTAAAGLGAMLPEGVVEIS